MFDDIAYNENNPDPGVLINVPNGPNVSDIYHFRYPNQMFVHSKVYEGVPHDYTKSHYTVENFYKVLAGNETSNGGKTLKSGPNDNVFLFYSDHGAPGLSGFGDEGRIFATDLIKVQPVTVVVSICSLDKHLCFKCRPSKTCIRMRCTKRCSSIGNLVRLDPCLRIFYLMT